MKDKNSPAGKALRTGYQSLVAVLPLITTILAIPELRDASNGLVAWSTAIVPVLAAVVSYLQNKKGL